LFEIIKKKGMKQPGLLDIGAGFTNNGLILSKSDYNFDKIAPSLKDILKKHFPKESYPMLKIIGEPGRFICE